MHIKEKKKIKTKASMPSWPFNHITWLLIVAPLYRVKTTKALHNLVQWSHLRFSKIKTSTQKPSIVPEHTSNCHKSFEPYLGFWVPLTHLTLNNRFQAQPITLAHLSLSHNNPKVSTSRKLLNVWLNNTRKIHKNKWIFSFYAYEL